MRIAQLLFLLLPALAAAQSATPAMRVGVTEVPHLTGVLNFREVGGIATVDGHVVRHGMVFRSAELSHLTPEDFSAATPLHIRFIFDLRTDAERIANPTHWTEPSPTIVPISVGFAANEPQSTAMRRLFAGGMDSLHVTEAMRNMTVQIALDGAAAIGQVLHDIAMGDEPALIHCTAGKDRTGVVTGVLLRILGVPLESIYADYVQSNDAVPAEMAHFKAMAGSAPAGAANPLAALPVDSIKVLMGVDRSYLEAAFAAMDAKYGSFDNYVSKGLMLTPSDVSGLRSRLLERAH